MRTPIPFFVAAMLVIGLAISANARHRHNHESYVTIGHTHLLEWDDNTSFDVHDGSVLITHKEPGEPKSVVEITESHELYIDDEKIDLDSGQRAAVAEFHDQCMDMVDYAKAIGLEGARIGVEGAKLGAKAVGSLFKLLLPDYDSDDYEAEMEHAAGKIEAKAKRLEARAEEIEHMADDLDRTADDLRDAIPELRRLRWF